MSIYELLTYQNSVQTEKLLCKKILIESIFEHTCELFDPITSHGHRPLNRRREEIEKSAKRYQFVKLH